MKDEEIEQVISLATEWKYMKELPETLHDFQLKRLQTRTEDVYNLYAYTNDALHRSVTVYFHAETKEYKVRFKLGSFEFCHDECISSSLEDFERLLRERFDGLLQNITKFDPLQVNTLLKNTNVLEWDFSSILPEKLNGFELFIRPSQPFCITNGSYIIIDYEHFVSQSNFAVYYNIFRDEFFCDTRIAGVPDVNYEFDSHNLEELQEKLSAHLDSRLQTILTSAQRSISA